MEEEVGGALPPNRVWHQSTLECSRPGKSTSDSWLWRKPSSDKENETLNPRRDIGIQRVGLPGAAYCDVTVTTYNRRR